MAAERFKLDKDTDLRNLNLVLAFDARAIHTNMSAFLSHNFCIRKLQLLFVTTSFPRSEDLHYYFCDPLTKEILSNPARSYSTTPHIGTCLVELV